MNRYQVEQLYLDDPHYRRAVDAIVACVGNGVIEGVELDETVYLVRRLIGERMRDVPSWRCLTRQEATIQRERELLTRFLISNAVIPRDLYPPTGVDMEKK